MNIMDVYLNLDWHFQLQKEKKMFDLEAQIVRFRLISLGSLNRG